MDKQAPALWTHHDRDQVADCRIYQIFREKCRHPRNGKTGDFYVMNTPDWALVVALTPDERLVMVNQYRFGSRSCSWEVPGGVINAGESPIEAAERELREETGYAGRDPVLLGSCRPNPALMNNYSHVVLIRDCEPRHATDWDAHEDITLALMDRKAVGTMIDDGRMHHALAIHAYYLLERYLAKNKA